MPPVRAPVALVLLVLLVPVALPRQQRRQKDEATEPAFATAQHHEQEAAEAEGRWAQRLSEFDRTSGERMAEANEALAHDRIAEACVGYEYIHRGLRGQPVSLGRDAADVLAERRALALPVRLKRDAVRELLAQKAQLERRAAREAGQQGQAIGEYKLEVSAEQHRLFGSPSESAALREILSNSTRAWWTGTFHSNGFMLQLSLVLQSFFYREKFRTSRWTVSCVVVGLKRVGFCDYCHPSHIGQLGNRHVSSLMKLRHDAEQLVYLLLEGKLPQPLLWPIVTAHLALAETIGAAEQQSAGDLNPIPFDVRAAQTLTRLQNAFVSS